MLKYYFGKSKKHPYEQQHIEVIVSKVAICENWTHF